MGFCTDLSYACVKFTPPQTRDAEQEDQRTCSSSEIPLMGHATALAHVRDVRRKPDGCCCEKRNEGK
jgi:hypothetical protein